MKPLLFFLVAYLCLPSATRAQADDLSELIDAMARELVDVDTEKYRYEQALTYEAEKPWRITLTVAEVNLKNDKTETSTYYLNLADINERLVTIETDRDEQLVIIKCDKRQDFIRLTDDNGDVSYESEVQLWSPEIDRATALQELFKQAAVQAAKDWEADFSPGEDLPALNRWLTDNISAVGSGEEAVSVDWSSDANLQDAVAMTVTESGKEQTTVYRFSLADLAKNSLELIVRKGSVGVGAATVKKANVILREEGGEPVGYDNNVFIPVQGIEEARRLMQSLEAAFPLARQVRDARMPQPDSLEEALDMAATLVAGAKRSGEEVSATLTPTPLTTLQLSITDSEKGDSETERYLFDFGDLNPRKVEFKVKGLALDVLAECAGGKDLIQTWEDGEEKGFEDEVAFPVSDVETARQLEALLPYIIEESAKIPIPTGDLAFVSAAVKRGSEEEVIQAISQKEDACKWDFVRREEGKKTTETLYEYNLYDIDAAKIRYEVSSKGVFVVLPAVGGEEIFNVYENDEPKFTDEMRWRMASVSDAKQVAATMKSLVGACEK